MPKIVDWYMQGKIEIDRMVTHNLPLDEINTAFDLMHEGKSIRSVIILALASGSGLSPRRCCWANAPRETKKIIAILTNSFFIFLSSNVKNANPVFLHSQL